MNIPNYSAYEMFFQYQKKTKDSFELLSNYREEDMKRNIVIMNDWKENSTEIVRLLRKSDLSVFAKTAEKALFEFRRRLDNIEIEGQYFLLLISKEHSFIIESAKLDTFAITSKLILKLQDEYFDLITSKIHPKPSIQIRKFPPHITNILMSFFIKSFFPTPQQINEMIRKTGISELQIQNWFKNRRKRDKKFLMPLMMPTNSTPLLSNPLIHSCIPNNDDDHIITVTSRINEINITDSDWIPLRSINK